MVKKSLQEDEKFWFVPIRCTVLKKKENSIIPDNPGLPGKWVLNQCLNLCVHAWQYISKKIIKYNILRDYTTCWRINRDHRVSKQHSVQQWINTGISCTKLAQTTFRYSAPEEMQSIVKKHVQCPYVCVTVHMHIFKIICLKFIKCSAQDAYGHGLVHLW